MKWKIPPRIKIYEALGCIADSHVKFVSESKAEVSSSEGFRKYQVVFDIPKMQITSNDNGSRYQGYLGYPSIAVLMLKGILPFDETVSNVLKGIKWYSLNKKFKNYQMTIDEAKRIAEERGMGIARLESFVDAVMNDIKIKKFDKYMKSQKRLDSF